MEETTKAFETLLKGAEDYARTTLELVKLKTVERVSDTVSSFVSRVTAFVFIFMFFLTGSVGLCLWLSELLGKIWAGFVLVAAFYGLIAVVLLFFLHKWFKKQIGNFIIRQTLN
jgi:hypothetical protein